MLVVMQQGATELQIQTVIDRLVSLGFTVHRSTGVVHTVLGGVGPADQYDPADFEVLDGVKEVHRIMSPYKLASRNFRPAGTVIRIRDVDIGANNVVVMAGPCSVESRDQILRAAESVAGAGAGAGDRAPGRPAGRLDRDPLHAERGGGQLPGRRPGPAPGRCRPRPRLDRRGRAVRRAAHRPRRSFPIRAS